MFSATDLTKTRSTQDAHMMDTCKRLVYGRTFNSFNEPIEAWTAATTAIICGLDMKAGNEIDKTTMTIVEYDAILRLPIATIVDPKDRIQITKRFGESITAIDYEIVSPIQRGPSGVRVLLRKVEI
jgi:hypothetical protein